MTMEYLFLYVRLPSGGAYWGYCLCDYQGNVCVTSRVLFVTDCPGSGEVLCGVSGRSEYRGTDGSTDSSHHPRNQLSQR
jgi:hypothetical protein